MIPTFLFLLRIAGIKIYIYINYPISKGPNGNDFPIHHLSTLKE